MSVATDIMRMYRAPRKVQARFLAGPSHEVRALACLMGACLLIYVAQWPRLAREAAVDPSIALEARLAGALFAWLMIMPLVFYLLALALSVLLNVLGRAVTARDCRIVLFWALLASTPLWLISGLLGGFAPGMAFGVVSAGAIAAVAVFTGSGVLAMTPGREGTT